MEIFGGFMVMLSILGLFLAVVWLIMPFVVFAVKGRQDRTLEVMEAIEKRLAAMERQLVQLQPVAAPCDPVDTPPAEAGTPVPDHAEQPVVLPLA